ncbi:MAG: hypothetical protein EOO14_02980 [Chitinophagaceae bacterium]|nr:MAG: hypothetical protein EOO14_02980 [Chitinophagaceae bacterium]
MQQTAENNYSIQESRQVIGWTVQNVSYTEVDYYPAHPQRCYTTENSQIHTVDFSVSLHFTNGKSMEISWKNFEIQAEEEYNAYGLSIRILAENAPSLAGQRTWDVSEETPWMQVVEQPVRDVKIYWSQTRVETPRETKELDFKHPQAIALHFPGDHTIFLSIAEFQSGNLHKVVRGVNNLLVTSNEVLARQTNMLSEKAAV